MEKDKLIQKVVSKINKYKENKIIFVAVDGVDTSGKTYFANEMARVKIDRPIVRLSIDNFHNPRDVRTKKGEFSPIGYYEDSFNYKFLMEEVFEKINSGILEVYDKSFDYRVNEDTTRKCKKIIIPENAIVIFDGVFLLREELNEIWDIRIFLDVSFEIVLERAMKRDLDYFKDADTLLDKYNKRYIPGQKIYFQRVNPISKADLVIDNNEYCKPRIIRSDL